MQPTILSSDLTLMHFKWTNAEDTGISVTYTVYISIFDPRTDFTVPALSVLERNVTATDYYFEGFALNKYYQFAVQAVNKLGIFLNEAVRKVFDKLILKIGESQISLPSEAHYAGTLPDPVSSVDIAGFVLDPSGNFSTVVSWKPARDDLSYMVRYTYLDTDELNATVCFYLFLFTPVTLYLFFLL